MDGFRRRPYVGDQIEGLTGDQHPCVQIIRIACLVARARLPPGLSDPRYHRANAGKRHSRLPGRCSARANPPRGRDRTPWCAGSDRPLRRPSHAASPWPPPISPSPPAAETAAAALSEAGFGFLLNDPDRFASGWFQCAAPAWRHDHRVTRALSRTGGVGRRPHWRELTPPSRARSCSGPVGRAFGQLGKGSGLGRSAAQVSRLREGAQGETASKIYVELGIELKFSTVRVNPIERLTVPDIADCKQDLALRVKS